MAKLKSNYKSKKLQYNFNENKINSLPLIKKKQKRKLSSDGSSSKTIKKSKTSIENNPAQGVIIVWFDPKNSDYLKRKARLRSIGNYLKKFDNINSCINYLLSIKNQSKQIFLILPGSSGKTILPFIYDEINIIYIYIFCKEKEKHEEWTKSYLNKIRGVFNIKQELLIKLNEDVEFYTKMIPISIIPAKQINNERSMRLFMKDVQLKTTFLNPSVQEHLT